MLAVFHRPLASCRLRGILALAVALIFAFALDTGIALARRGGGHGGGGQGGAGHTAGHGGGGHGRAPKSEQVASHRSGTPGGFGGPSAGSICEPASPWYEPEYCRQRDR